MELIEDVHFAAIEWIISCLFFQSRRDDPKLAQATLQAGYPGKRE
jgi:hypothetical protein